MHVSKKTRNPRVCYSAHRSGVALKLKETSRAELLPIPETEQTSGSHHNWFAKLN